MAISPLSDHNRFRPAAEPLSRNYVGEAPLETHPGPDAVKNKTRPNFNSPEANPLADHPVTAASTLVRGYVPLSQGGLVSGKEIINPTAKGYSRSSVFNLLIAGNQQNLDRQNRAILDQEATTREKTTERKQAGL